MGKTEAYNSKRGRWLKMASLPYFPGLDTHILSVLFYFSIFYFSSVLFFRCYLYCIRRMEKYGKSACFSVSICMFGRYSNDTVITLLIYVSCCYFQQPQNGDSAICRHFNILGDKANNKMNNKPSDHR